MIEYGNNSKKKKKKGYLSLSRSSSQLFRVGLDSILLPIRPWLRRCSPYHSRSASVLRVLINYPPKNTQWIITDRIEKDTRQKRFEINWTWMSPRRSPMISSVSVDNAWVRQVNHTSSDIFTHVRAIIIPTGQISFDYFSQLLRSSRGRNKKKLMCLELATKEFRSVRECIVRAVGARCSSHSSSGILDCTIFSECFSLF